MSKWKIRFGGTERVTGSVKITNAEITASSGESASDKAAALAEKKYNKKCDEIMAAGTSSRGGRFLFRRSKRNQ